MNQKRELEKKEQGQDKKLKLTPAMQSIMDQDYQYSSTDSSTEEKEEE